MGEMRCREGDGLNCTNFPECRQTTSHIHSCIQPECHTQHTEPPMQPQSSLDIRYFGCNSSLQVDDVDVTSSELMHDLYQFHRS